MARARLAGMSYMECSSDFDITNRDKATTKGTPAPVSFHC
jgi:hypothetical protein